MRSYSQERPICSDVVCSWFEELPYSPLLGLECEDFQSGTNGGPASPHCHFQGLMRHLAGLAMRDLDLLRGANHDL